MKSETFWFCFSFLFFYFFSYARRLTFKHRFFCSKTKIKNEKKYTIILCVKSDAVFPLFLSENHAGFKKTKKNGNVFFLKICSIPFLTREKEKQNNKRIEKQGGG